MLWIGDGVLKHYYATFNILKRHKENKQTHTCVAVAQLKKHNLTLMDPKWHPYSHHPHCRATSNRMWRLSFSCISFLLYQVRMSPKAIEHLNLNFWNFTYYIYIYIFFHDCFSLMLFLHIPFILIHVFLLHSFFFFFADDYFWSCFSGCCLFGAVIENAGLGIRWPGSKSYLHHLFWQDALHLCGSLIKQRRK